MKKINNLNEEINRIKSLFTEERLYGNLVKKELITEQVIRNIGRTIGKSIDDIIKAGDDVVKNIKIPKKQLDDFKLKMSGVKSFDDMAVALKNTEYDKIWSMLGFSDKQLFGIRETLNPPYNGNFGTVVEASGYPLFRYLPSETKHVKNFRKDMFDMWLVHGPKEEVDVFLKDYKKGLSKFSDDAIERTKSAREKPKVKPDEPKVKPDEPKVKPDEPKVKPDEPKVKLDGDSGTFKVTSLKELDELITTLTKKNVTTEIKIVMADGSELIVKVDGRTTKEIVEEMGEQLPKGFSDQAKKGIKERMVDYIKSLKLNKNVGKSLNFVTGGNVWSGTWVYKPYSNGKEWVVGNRFVKFIARAIPLTYTYWSYEMGRPLGIGEYFGSIANKFGISWDDAKETLTQEICDAGLIATDNAFNCAHFYVYFKDGATKAINSTKLDCTKILSNDYEENKQYLFDNIDIKYVKGSSKMTNEDGVTKKTWRKYHKDWDTYWGKYLGTFVGGKDWDTICQDLMNTKVAECQLEQSETDMKNDGYEWEDDVTAGGDDNGEDENKDINVGGDGKGCDCGDGSYSPFCC